MGSLCSSLSEEERAALKRNRAINKINADHQDSERHLAKLLLLGTGESGKSTIFKQVKQLYGQKWSEKELKDWIPRVYENINGQILAMLKARKVLNIKLVNESLAAKFDRYMIETPVNTEVAGYMKELWADEGFQKVWERRAEYQVLECIEYYMENIDRIAEGTKAKNYVPTFQDIVQARVRTSGITQIRFKMYDANFIMFDVGGQRSERKKWLNCFDNVLTVLYIAAINEYDQKLFEDSKTDRVKEAVKVWSDIVNRESFQDIGFVLFLNKWDLFQKKVLEFPFKIPGSNGRNQDYEGMDPMDETLDDKSREMAVIQCAEHMKAKFIDVIEPRTGYGAISSHLTNATDTEMMKLVFHNCQDQILRRNLVTNGFGYSIVPHSS